MIDFDLFFVLYMALILGPLTGLWIASAWRDRRLRGGLSAKWLYRCAECLRFYEADEEAGKLPCPICGRQNDRLKI